MQNGEINYHYETENHTLQSRDKIFYSQASILILLQWELLFQRSLWAMISLYMLEMKKSIDSRGMSMKFPSASTVGIYR